MSYRGIPAPFWGRYPPRTTAPPHGATSGPLAMDSTWGPAELPPPWEQGRPAVQPTSPPGASPFSARSRGSPG
eukprot:11482995-Alexandrium_andersonii.AAC.1